MAGNRCHLRHSCHFPYHINHHVLSILANLKQIKTSLLLSVHPQAQLFIPLPCFISYVPKCHCLLSDFLASSLFPAHLNASAKFTFHKCKAISTFNVFIHYLFGCTRSQWQHVGSSIFIAACDTFTCSMQTLSCDIWDLVPTPRTQDPVLGAWSLSHWTIREVLGHELRPSVTLFLPSFHATLRSLPRALQHPLFPSLCMPSCFMALQCTHMVTFPKKAFPPWAYLECITASAKAATGVTSPRQTSPHLLFGVSTRPAYHMPCSSTTTI